MCCTVQGQVYDRCVIRQADWPAAVAAAVVTALVQLDSSIVVGAAWQAQTAGAVQCTLALHSWVSSPPPLRPEGLLNRVL